MGMIPGTGIYDGEMGGRDSLEVFFVAGGGRCACKGGNPAYPYITTDLAFHRSRGYSLDADRDAEAIVPQPIFPVIDHKAGRNTGFTLCVHPAEFVIFLDGGGAFHA